MIYYELYSELKNYFTVNDKDISDFTFLAQHLSLVRNQGHMVACSYVHAIACTEMIFRICERRAIGIRGEFYFNIDDCFDNLYKEHPYLPDAAKKLRCTMGVKDIRVSDVLLYIHKSGLLPHSGCINPRERNLLSHFQRNANRNRSDGYRELRSDEVLSLLRTYPIIAVMKSYPSYKGCGEVVYGGPTKDEIAELTSSPRCHTVLLVGRFALKTDDGEHQYIIVQNCYGVRFGFRGYVVMRFDAEHFVEFWLPMLSPHMDYLKESGSERQESPSTTS